MTMQFKPSPAFKSRYYLEYGLAFVLGIFPWSIPVTLFIPSDYLLIWVLTVHLPTFALLAYTFWWIPQYYKSANFVVNEKETISRFGVFWKQERRVDLSKVNMVHISQGPIQRHFHTKHLHIHTAALGAASAAEVIFFDLPNAEEIRTKVLGFIEGRRSEAELGGGELIVPEKEKASVGKIIEELTAIRKLLKKEIR
jgi:hypothetical protein